MSETTWADIAPHLRAPFRDDEIEHKPAKGGSGKTLPYVKAPAIMDRLDAVVGPGNWSVDAGVADAETGTVRVTLTIFGVSMTDFGDSNNPKSSVGGQAFKESASDGLKRAARLFGIGRYLWQGGKAQPSPQRPSAQAAQQQQQPTPLRPEQPAQQATTVGALNPASEAQIKMIWATARGKWRMDDADLEGKIRSKYGVRVLGLSKRQASEVIEQLQGAGL